MNSSIQKFVLLGVIVFLIGGLTFVRNWTQPKEAAEEQIVVDVPAKAKTVSARVEPKAAEEEPHVIFPVTIMEPPRETEHMASNHADFWFQNPNAYDVDIGMELKSCKCTRVEVLNLTPAQERILRGPLLNAAVADMCAGTAGILPYLMAVGAAQVSIYPFMAEGDHWKRLIVGDDKGLPIAKGSTAFMRLIWDGRNQQAIRLGVKLWVQRADDRKSRGGWTQLEAPVNIVPALRVYPEVLNVYDMDSTRSTATAEFVAWSSSRANMTITAAEDTNDPAFTCVATELRGPDFRDMVARLAEKLDPPPQPVLLYSVQVTVRDHPPEAPLDWGAFHRSIVVKTDKPDINPIVIRINGSMRGLITVGSAESRDKIKLPDFPSRDGITQTIPIGSNVPGISLEVESWTPEYLAPELHKRDEPDGLSHWDLTVKVPANRLLGSLPPNSAVILKTIGPNPRRIRIPVSGKGTI